MKNLKIRISLATIALAITLLFSQKATAQAAFELQFITDVDTVNSELDVTLQVRSVNQEFVMGDANFVFTFNSTTLSNPVLHTIHNYTGPGNNQTYAPMSFSTSGNEIDIEVEYIEPGNSNNYNNADAVSLNTWTNIATVRFDISTYSGNSDLTWDTIQTQIINRNGQVPMSTTTNFTEPLPVEFKYFNAEAKANEAYLTWATASERNNNGFFVERSTDGDNWREIGFVRGNGNSGTTKRYAYTDSPERMGSVYYYRLRQVDFDGTEDFSVVKSVRFGIQNNEREVFSFYPVPVTDRLQVKVDHNTDIEGMHVEVYDLSGRIIEKKTVEYEITTVDFTLYNRGIYIVRLTDKNGEELHRQNVPLNK